MKQTELEYPFPKREIPKEWYYMDLNINQKINLKANSCGFQIIYLRHFHRKKCLTIHPRSECFTHLNKKYAWHYKHNFEHSLSTQIFLRGRKNEFELNSIK